MKWTLRVLAVVVMLVALVLAGFSWQAARREVVDPEKGAPPGGRYVKADDVSLFVQETGPAAGAPVLFVHGTGAWSEAWRGTMKAVAATGARAIAVDLPPFGFSQRPAEPRYGKLEQGRRIAALIDALDLREVVLVGHSFGGGPTTEAALLAHERVRALVLVDAALSVGADGEAAPQRSAALDALLAARPLRDAIVATFLTNPMFSRKLLEAFIDNPAHATDDWVRLYQHPLVVRGTTAAVGRWLPELLAPARAAASERPASYRGLKMPVFLIWGARDDITPLAQGRQIAKLAPRAELTVLENVGHIPQIEDPDAFHRALVAALARASSASSSR